jgi:hypothetical protein
VARVGSTSEVHTEATSRPFLGPKALRSVTAGVGPVVARPPGIEKSYGAELQLREGAGSSDGAGLTVFELQGRAAVTERASAISVGLGPAYLHWLGPAALMGRISPMLGVQYFDRTVFASAGLNGGLGLGFVLEESVHDCERRELFAQSYAQLARRSASVTMRIIASSGEASKPSRR